MEDEFGIVVALAAKRSRAGAGEEAAQAGVLAVSGPSAMPCRPATGRRAAALSAERGFQQVVVDLLVANSTIRRSDWMILEVAVLNVRQGQSGAFEEAFRKAQKIIAAIPGYVSHELQRCIEDNDKYLLLVRWRRLEDHTIGFRQSAQYQEWKRLLHHFYDPFPSVEHFEVILESARDS